MNVIEEVYKTYREDGEEFTILYTSKNGKLHDCYISNDHSRIEFNDLETIKLLISWAKEIEKVLPKS